MLRTMMWGVVVALAVTGTAMGDVLWINPGDASYSSMTRDAKLRGDGDSGAPDYVSWVYGNIGNGSGGSNRFYPRYNSDGTPSGRLNNFVQWFDVSSIPAGSVINQASLWVYMAGGTTTAMYHDVKLSRLQPGKSWNEGVGMYPYATDGSVTWGYQNQPVGTTWSEPGGTGALDIDLATTKSLEIAPNNWLEIDIKSWVQAWVDGTWVNTGMNWWGGRIDNGSGSNYWFFKTKEDAGEGVGPELWIDYTVPEPATLMLLGLGLVGLLRRR